MKGKKKNSGITLIALIITIIILLILAGISLNFVFDSNGLFEKSNQAAQNYNKEKSREELTLVLNDAKMIKYSEGLDDAQLDEKLNKVGRLDDNDNTKVAVNGYVWKINRETLEIEDCLGEDDGIEITYTITGNEQWTKEARDIKVEVTVKNNKGELDERSIVIMQEGENITESVTINNGKFILTTNKSTTYTVSAKNSEGKQSLPRIIKVKAKIDNTAPEIKSITATVEGFKIKIAGQATDEESQVRELKYKITPTEGVVSGQATGTIKIGETKEVLTIKEGKEYTVTITGIDNVGNETTEENSGKTNITTISGMTIEDAKRIVNKDNIQGYIGTKITDYNPTASGTWRIFYYDLEDDGNKNGYFGPTGTIYLKRECTNSLTSYKHFSHTSSDNGTIMKRMNPKWRDYPTANANQINLQTEIHAAWLCDPSTWISYKVEDLAEFAIGGPSIEMCIKAYNLWKDNDINSNTIECKVDNNNGYKVGKKGDYSISAGNSVEIGTLGTQGPELIFGDNPSTNRVCLASPAGAGGSALAIIDISAKSNICSIAVGAGAAFLMNLSPVVALKR